MTKAQFQAECGQRLIDPSIALENEDIVEALHLRDDALVIQLLDEEF